MKKILMEYVHENDFTRQPRFKIIEIPERSYTWRELQKLVDPGYHYDNLRFYNLGSRIE